jgi:hypothetical protein
LFWTLVLVVGLGLTDTYLWFLWYRTDSDARGFQRSAWLSVGVVVFPPGAIPYYLVRSRPRQQRLRTLAVFAGYVLLTLGAELAGMAIHAGLRQRPQKSTVADTVNVRGAPSTR